MDIDVVRTTLEQAGLAAVAVGFAIGFLFSFNPVALASIPVSLAYVTKAHEPKRAVAFGAMFVAGMIVAHALLGLIAGLGGAWVQKLIGRQWGLVLGPLLILLGIVWAGWVRLPLSQISIRAQRAATGWGAFGLGGSFSVAVCPACTPALVVLLGVAAGIGSAIFGLILLLAFGIGRSIPVILGAWAIGWLEGLKGLSRSQRAFDIVGGIVLILSGLYMLNAYFFIIPELAG